MSITIVRKRKWRRNRTCMTRARAAAIPRSSSANGPRASARPRRTWRARSATPRGCAAWSAIPISSSYYAQVMFSTHHGDDVLATDSQNIPTYDWQIPGRRRNGVEQPASTRQVPSLFFDATRDSANGTIYLKVVNRLGTPQLVKIEISGVASVEAKGTATVLKADSPDDTNSIQEPKKIVPATETAEDLGASFTRTFPPCSITILELKAK